MCQHGGQLIDLTVKNNTNLTLFLFVKKNGQNENIAKVDRYGIIDSRFR